MTTGPTINDVFPNLNGATQNTTEFDLYEYLGDSWGIIFMHPGDFTPVCTTELGAAAQLEPEFTKKNVKLCGFSCNDAGSHQAWIEDILAVTGSQVDFPLFCDPDRTVSAQLGILDVSNLSMAGLPLTVRSVFIVRPNRTIALMMTYPASCGRNFDEILRVVDSLQLTVEKKVATPANWKSGDEVIVDFSLSNEQANEQFGPDGYRIMPVPSEQGKQLSKNYLRYTSDPRFKEASTF